MTGSDDDDAAGTSAASTPRPPVSARAASRTPSPPATNAASAPIVRASSTRRGSRSTPITVQPAALAICTTSSPISPSPITAIVSPNSGSARRSPWRPIAPTVANAACSSSTPAGTGAARLTGTRTISACDAYPPPAHATRSPTRKASTPSPTAITTPADE